MINENVLIYGAYGYTGKLIVELAVSMGYCPALGGRNEQKVNNLAKQYNLESHIFNYNDQKGWDDALKGKTLLLNCAGPFSLTIKDILPACLRNNIHYLDITGEIDVFAFIKKSEQEAINNGLVLMPGTGFDVVPTDCLALYLKEQMPDATHLELAFDSKSGLSRGTALSVLNRFDQGSATRVNGKIVPEKTASSSKIIHFGGKDRLCVGIAWGDIFTAFLTTKIPNIKVFTGMPEKTLKSMRKASKWAWLITAWPVQQLLRSIVKMKIDGPSKERRETVTTYLWGKVTNTNGKTIEVELETSESYKLTAITALMCVEGVLTGKVRPGYNTPALAFGADFILKTGAERRMI